MQSSERLASHEPRAARMTVSSSCSPPSDVKNVDFVRKMRFSEIEHQQKIL
jgi:hypothetical protein